MEGTLVWFSSEKKIGLVKDKDGRVFIVHSDQLPKNKSFSAGSKIVFQLGDFPGFIESAKDPRK